MQTLRVNPNLCREGFLTLRCDEIVPNPIQPRRRFDEEQLRELSDSIRAHGLLHPLTVRFRNGRYELIAGERRLRAAKLAGLTSVPCLLRDAAMEEAGLLALIENLQRQDLDFVEEAHALRRLIRMFGFSQEECARRLGKSQSAIANKLRLLKLPEDVLTTLLEKGLTERHGRALLRLPDAKLQREALRHILAHSLTVSAAEEYIDLLLASPKAPEPREGKKSFILKDIRVFLNTLNHSVEVMKQGGIDAAMHREETNEAYIVTISIPKSAKTT